MSITDAFDDATPEILRPNQIAPPIDGFPDVAVATFRGGNIHLAAQSYPCEEIGSFEAGETIPIHALSYRGVRVALYRTLIGGSGAAAMLEEVISKGARKIVFFGSCGALDASMTAGRVIVPTSAYRDEGVSYHYAPPDNDYIEIATAQRLSDILTELHVPHVRGKTWTTDALYRETRRNTDRRIADGCVAVEQECACVMAVGQYRGVSVYQFLYCADSIASGEWDARLFGTMGGGDHDVNMRYLELALEVAVRV
jgi:purine-nucleoside phosphorylase